MTERAAAPPALRAIITYKTVKAGLQLLAAALLLALWPLGLPAWIAELSLWLRHHGTHGWAVYGAGEILGHSTPRRLELTILALAADGLLTALEAWALRSGRAWGPWLVVAAAAALLPFEMLEFARNPRWSRFAIFALNLVIALYLGRHAWREHRHATRSAG